MKHTTHPNYAAYVAHCELTDRYGDDAFPLAPIMGREQGPAKMPPRPLEIGDQVRALREWRGRPADAIGTVRALYVGGSIARVEWHGAYYADGRPYVTDIGTVALERTDERPFAADQEIYDERWHRGRM